MKIKDGFVLRDIAGDTVVIATGEISKTFHGMIRLNSTGKEIWEILSSRDLSEDEVIAEMAKRHDAKPISNLRKSALRSCAMRMGRVFLSAVSSTSAGMK